MSEEPEKYDVQPWLVHSEPAEPDDDHDLEARMAALEHSAGALEDALADHERRIAVLERVRDWVRLASETRRRRARTRPPTAEDQEAFERWKRDICE